MIVSFPIYPLRSIEVVRNESGKWFGNFAGDGWTKPFRTEAGDRLAVLDALRLWRQGLPIEDFGARRFPYPASHSPRFAVDPWAPEYPGSAA